MTNWNGLLYMCICSAGRSIPLPVQNPFDPVPMSVGSAIYDPCRMVKMAEKKNEDRPRVNRWILFLTEAQNGNRVLYIGYCGEVDPSYSKKEQA